MKQLLQDMATGILAIKTSPSPMPSDDELSIITTTTLISSGTEKMLVGFGKASYLQKARQQPEKVKMVLEKIKTDGIYSTIEAVRSKLTQPFFLGYCHVGVVSKIGKHVHGFKPGDRIISNGPHADMVIVAKNLCAHIPDAVDDESAAFTVIASIGLQGVRLAQPTLGEAFVVIGVGLIGLLTVQLLRAHGCRVLAIDFDDNKLKLAQQFGAEICNLNQNDDVVTTAMAFSRWQGVDGVIITASTQSTVPITQAAQMSRKRGRIVLVGVAGLKLNRADFYEKELTFQVSCSYGPGRYDPLYEKQGLDYPIAFVRWTEQRNFEAILDMMADGQINVKPLITHKYLFEEALQAYQTLLNDRTALGILLKYQSKHTERSITEININSKAVFDHAKPILGFIGAGNYASRLLIPAFKAAGAQCHTIVTSSGISAAIQGEKSGFAKASTDIDALLSEKHINSVVIATRHNTHAKLVIRALNAGKHVFVEKPLAINLDELAELEAAYHTAHLQEKKLHLMVGFNRRFSPHIKKMKQLLLPMDKPKSFIMTINASSLPYDHWLHDPLVGGGRIIGEACHFIDLMRYLAGCEIISIQCRCLGQQSNVQIKEDTATITLGFSDGSFGSIHYLANGALGFPKERIELFTAGRVLQLDNFRKLKGFGWPKFKRMNLWKQDKGQEDCSKSFIQAIEQGLETPIPFNEIIEVARVSIEAAQQLCLQYDNL